jgi:uncharacterized membrane protein
MKNQLLWGLLIVIAVVFAIRIIRPLFSMAFNVLAFAIVAAVIYSFINPEFRQKMLSVLSFIKNQFFNKK